MLAAAAQAQTYKICYIISGSDTSVHNSNVDSIRYDIVNDPQGQLPGTWQMDLLRRADAEGKDSSYWNLYDIIMTWGAEEGGSATYNTSIDGILDTIRKPVICRDAYVAKADPMWLGTTRITSLNTTNAPSHFRVKNTTSFITKKLYTDNYNFGDSLALYALTSSPNTDGLTGMAHEVQTLLRMARDYENTDADSAVLVICEEGDTNSNNTLAPAKRAFISINSSWRYCSWNARDLFYRTLRWAIADTVIDTCVTQVRIAREGIDGSWMEYSGISCQQTWHYGGIGSIRMGYEVDDRVPLLRIRTTAINTQLPDTSDSWAYDIASATMVGTISLIGDNTPSYSWWQGLFALLPDTLWQDAKASIQLDSTCGSWSADEVHAYSNHAYLKYPSIAWNTVRASTRGTDYSTVAYDSVWIQNPIVSNVIHWTIPTAEFETMMDSTTNKGMVIHTIGTKTGTAEIDMWPEHRNDSSAPIRAGMHAFATLTWRAANSGTADLDSTILIQDLSGNDSLEFDVVVNAGNPDPQTLMVSNGSSSAQFDCASTAEDPAVDWLTTSIIGGGTTTYYVICGIDQTGLAVGYYSTNITATCADVSNSPYSIKIILRVNAEAARTADGTVKIR